MHRRALQYREEVLGPEHPDTLHSVWSVAFFMKNNQKYDDALAYYQRACLGYKKVFGKGHPDTVECMQQYSALMEEMNQLEAEPLGPTE